MTQQEFIAAIAPLCQKYAKQYGFKVASPAIAQACLESAYGTSYKAKFNNLFGLKYRANRVTCNSGYFQDGGSEQNANGSYSALPSSTAWYAFSNMEKGVEGYYQFINIANYTKVKQATTPLAYLQAIKDAGYATSLQYVTNVNNVITKWGLTKYDTIGETTQQTKVKESASMGFSPYVCMQTHSTCYQGTRAMDVKGVLWHSTGANNPNLKRYVQPYETDANYAEAIQVLGKNTNRNDWNHISHQAGLNAWIGKFADGSIGTVQTMPWNYRPWGCGSGSKGSCNNGWIQFEICEDGLTDKAYAQKVWDEAIELTVYLCKMFNLNPNGTVNINGAAVPVITCHNDAYKLGVGSGHADINHWFPKILGKSMADVRAEVAARLGGDTTTSSKSAQQNTTSSSSAAVNYSAKVTATTLNVRSGPGTNYPVKSSLKQGSVVTIIAEQNGWSQLQGGAGWVSKTYLEKVIVQATPAQSQGYTARVTATTLNVRSGPGTNYKVTTTVKKGGVYTIVEESNGWGKLKSGAGWVSLQYMQKT